MSALEWRIKMSVSIVLSTYNGEKYIFEQLLSLYNQEMTADEVIICDDCSSDKTVSIIRDFIAEKKLKHWSLFCNEKNVGWKRNFQNLILKASGDIIFTCDQDDIWYKDKIKNMVQVLENNAEILLLASDYEPIYEIGGKKISQCNSTYKKELISKCDYNDFWKIRRPGCTYCFRRELAAYMRNYCLPDYPHDAFLWRTACILDGLYIFNQATIKFRRHDANETMRKKASYNEKIESLTGYYSDVIAITEKILSDVEVNNKVQKYKMVEQCREWRELRLAFLRNHNFGAGIRLIKRMKLYYSYKTYLKDWILSVHSLFIK